MENECAKKNPKLVTKANFFVLWKNHEPLLQFLIELLSRIRAWGKEYNNSVCNTKNVIYSINKLTGAIYDMGVL